MRILLVSQYFYPEPFIINDLVKTLVGQGHEIVVYTGKPNYPDGDIYDGYSEAEFGCEFFHEKVKVYRVPLRPRGNGGAKNIFLNYLSFVFSGLKYSSKIEEKDFDVIFAFGLSPITSAIPAIYLKRKLGCKLTLWVQDLWPESLVATGYVKSRILLYPVSLMVQWIYSNCDQILVQSKGFKIPVSKYTNKELIYYPNSIKTKKDERESSFPVELEGPFGNNFCLVFAGNLGRAQSLEVILDAAENLMDLDKFKIIIVGSGSLTKWLVQQKSLRGLCNVELVGRYPMDTMPAIYRRADGLIVTLRDNKVVNYTIPSKIQSYLSSGKPIIGALNGEGASVIKDSKSGFISQADCSIGLEKSIRKLYLLTNEERLELGKNSINYFHDNFDMDVQASQLIDIFTLNKCIKS